LSYSAPLRTPVMLGKGVIVILLGK
jgi:hypothetical protein